jgi:predicted pyridoxine 5'-phosphate oxidase superfamily flavin-nucleotide-binding protein
MTTDQLPSRPTPWHAGERAMQTRVGVGERMARVGGRAIRDFMPDQHRDFFARLPFLVVGSVDHAGWVWASLLAGRPGFAASPDPRSLTIAALPVAGDPLAGALAPGTKLGLLGIELPSRRRNRMNGSVIALDGAGFTVAVEQSFGNCPQYIQARDYASVEATPAGVRVETFTALDEAARALIARSDTFFVASASGSDGRHDVDVSHRGGRPGFVGIDGDGALVVPDYAGNRFFNTLGNLTANPRAGLLFVDFASGDLLQLTGTTTIVWEGPALNAFAGAERLWRVAPSQGRWLRGALPLRLELREFSPTLEGTGTWYEAQAVMAGEDGADSQHRGQPAVSGLPPGRDSQLDSLATDGGGTHEARGAGRRCDRRRVADEHGAGAEPRRERGALQGR